MFHCDVHRVKDETSGLAYPVVFVPGGHTAPIRSKADGPNGRIKINSYYIRRPGPSSDTPRSGREWDALLHRCYVNKGDQLLGAIRGVVLGEVRSAPAAPTEEEMLQRWTEESLERWREQTSALPPDAPARLPHGSYAVSVAVIGDFEDIDSGEIPERVRRSAKKYSGWPPFYVFSEQGLRPNPVGRVIESWMDPAHSRRSDSARADFWRASPDGRLFLIRGYNEDAMESDGVQPGTELRATTTVYRWAEILSFVASYAENIAGPSARILVLARFTGLRGRELTIRRDPSFFSLSGHVSRQDTFEKSVSFDVERLRLNLPEVVRELLAELYLGFGLFKLEAGFVNHVIERMRGNARR